MRQYKDTRYWVSEEGDIVSFTPGIKTKYAYQTYEKPDRWRILKPPTNNRGYKTVTLRVNNKTVGRLVHRLVAELYCEGYFEDAHVDHIDCNNQNNHSNNLQWCTKEYNEKKGNNPNYLLFAQI